MKTYPDIDAMVITQVKIMISNPIAELLTWGETLLQTANPIARVLKIRRRTDPKLALWVVVGDLKGQSTKCDTTGKMKVEFFERCAWRLHRHYKPKIWQNLKERERRDVERTNLRVTVQCSRASVFPSKTSCTWFYKALAKRGGQ
jgi:hypothetical protein